MLAQFSGVAGVNNLPNLPPEEIARPPTAVFVASLRNARIECHQAVMAMAESDGDNLQASKFANYTHGVLDIVAWVSDSSLNEHYKYADAQDINFSNSRLVRAA